MKKNTVYAFIDSQNLYIAIKQLGWELDFERFRKYLTHKYKVQKAFLFIGYLKSNIKLYTLLEKYGYLIIFKPTLGTKDNVVKGNCDAELVLHSLIEKDNYQKAIIISGDGDFYCLLDYLLSQNKLFKIGIPSRKSYSSLLRKFRQYFFYVSDLTSKVSKHRISNKAESGSELAPSPFALPS